MKPLSPEMIRVLLKSSPVPKGVRLPHLTRLPTRYALISRGLVDPVSRLLLTEDGLLMVQVLKVKKMLVEVA